MVHSGMLNLDEELLISRNTITAVRVLRRLAIGSNPVNDCRPVSTTVNLGGRILVDVEGFAGSVGERDGVVDPSTNLKQSAYVLTVKP